MWQRRHRDVNELTCLGTRGSLVRLHPEPLRQGNVLPRSGRPGRRRPMSSTSSTGPIRRSIPYRSTGPEPGMRCDAVRGLRHRADDPRWPPPGTPRRSHGSSPGRGRRWCTQRELPLEKRIGFVGLLDHLGIGEADLFDFSLGGLVAYEIALGATCVRLSPTWGFRGCVERRCEGGQRGPEQVWQ
jgi:hypothetical protein